MRLNRSHILYTQGTLLDRTTGRSSPPEKVDLYSYWPDPVIPETPPERMTLASLETLRNSRSSLLQEAFQKSPSTPRGKKAGKKKEKKAAKGKTC